MKPFANPAYAGFNCFRKIVKKKIPKQYKIMSWKILHIQWKTKMTLIKRKAMQGSTIKFSQMKISHRRKVSRYSVLFYDPLTYNALGISNGTSS